jgi:hypothetical protein
MRGEQATAQSGPLHILVVEYDIVPAEIDKYLTAIKELGAAAVKERSQVSASSVSRSRKRTRTMSFCLRRGTMPQRSMHF